MLPTSLLVCCLLSVSAFAVDQTNGMVNAKVDDGAYALASEPGRFSSYDEATKYLAKAPIKTVQSKPAEPSSTLSSESCPYTVEEIQSALGLKVKPPKVSEAAFPGGKEVSCDYAATDVWFTSLLVKLTSIAPKDFASSMATLDKFLAGKSTPIEGDKDGAKWQIDPYDESNLALHYSRGYVRTEVRAFGGKFKTAEMQAKLLKLRRVP